ncbi:ABC transporter ATP-binding protein [Clostridium sp. Marseille-P299]|uniref:ABC transporter ATP-binding protein n=1 Tax=Clostridium sp. Marseille-P299 TaxID=1805477 RepID=UPI0009EDAF3D|nr:ABC transporter ATP-binding protein [Clostridium sp. Marseille-P299]
MSLVIKKLNVKLQKEDILHEVNMEIKDGEFISLLGASGCGKSTLLKSIAGLIEIESGEISVNEKSMKEIPPEKRGTVIVFQDLRLFPHMTVEKNIAFSMELKKIPKKIQKERVSQLLKEVQLEGFEKRKIREMSGGQLQRVALARALAAEPRVLLLDEPFSGLDGKLRIEMASLVKKLHETRCLTTILVTHDKQEALQLSDRIALMSEGRIIQYDVPHNILYHPKNQKVEEYIGKANCMIGTVKNGRFIGKACEWEADLEDGVYEVNIAVDGSGFTYFRKEISEN